MRTSQCRMLARKRVLIPHKTKSILSKPPRGHSSRLEQELVFFSVPQYYSYRYGVWAIMGPLGPYWIHVYQYRFRYELWRLPRVLLRQLDSARQSQPDRYHRNHLKRRHVPVHAIPVCTLHPTMGPQAADRCLLRRYPHMRQLPAFLLQHQCLASRGDTRRYVGLRMRPHLQPHDPIPWRMVQHQ